MVGKIIITGRIPSKKNSRITVRATGMSFPSSDYTSWHRNAGRQIMGSPKMNGKGITMDFWLPDNRKTDLNNKAASILDLMKDMGIIEDDAWQIIGWEHYNPMGIDKENPRVEITYPI